MPEIAEQKLRVVGARLENRADSKDRRKQMEELLAKVADYRGPMIIAGDSTQPPASAH